MFLAVFILLQMCVDAEIIKTLFLACFFSSISTHEAAPLQAVTSNQLNP